MLGRNRSLVYKNLIMSEIVCQIEIRQDESRLSPGRVCGTLLTYGERALDRPEVFAVGSIDWPEVGIILNEQHNRQSPIVRFVPRVEGRALLIDQPLPDTTRGRDMAIMVRNGTLQGLSIEFRPLKESTVGGVRNISKAVLTGAALVDAGSYRTSVELRERQHSRRRYWL